MRLNSVDDARTPLERATRGELIKFARMRGVKIDQQMPAILMRQILYRNGCADIEKEFPYLLRRTVGQINGVNAHHYKKQEYDISGGISTDSASDLERQWKAQHAQPEDPVPIPEKLPTPPPVERMKMHELRRLCKDAGIKFTPSDKAATLRARLNGENIT